MPENKIIVLSGFSSSGKDTLLSKIVKNNPAIHPVVSNSSRPIRENETDGVEYNFVSKQSFIDSIENNEMLEHRTYNVDFEGEKDIWYYGISKKSMNEDKAYAVVLDINGVKALKEIYGDRVVSIFVHVEDDIRKQRAVSRGSFDEVEWERRLKDDKTIFQEVGVCDYFIENVELDETVAVIENIIKNEVAGAVTDGSIIDEYLSGGGGFELAVG